MDTPSTPEVQITSETPQGTQTSQVPQPPQPPQSSQNIQPSETPDVDMNGAQDTTDDRNGGERGTQQDTTLPDAQPTEPEPEPTPAGPIAQPKKNTGFSFLDYLTSPIVELVVGQDENETVLTAHQNLLRESPFLSESIANFNEVSPRRISLPDENVEAFGCFLQFQYTRDYTSMQLETPRRDAGTTLVDDSGEQLLKHARVYTLAEKLGIPALKALAHSKIHKINSSAHGEIIYARYVYTHTPPGDTTIRRPVAAFWATRSHVLRHEAKDEFTKLCIEVPEFSFDVLSLVLDQKEKRGQDKAEAESGTKASGRKRQRSGI